MSTKKESKQTQTTQFDPQSMDAYHQNIGAGTSALNDLIADPLKSTFFNSQLDLTRARSQRVNQTNIWQAMNNVQGLGGSNGYNPLLSRVLAGQRRGQTANDALDFHNLLLDASNRRQQAIGQALSFSPLQTGGTGTSMEKTSGLGTWLPQLAAAGIGAATSFATGGLSSAFGMGAGPMTGSGANPLGSISRPLPMYPSNNYSNMFLGRY